LHSCLTILTSKCKTSIWSLYSHLAQVFSLSGMKMNHIY